MAVIDAGQSFKPSISVHWSALQMKSSSSLCRPISQNLQRGSGVWSPWALGHESFTWEFHRKNMVNTWWTLVFPTKNSSMPPKIHQKYVIHFFWKELNEPLTKRRAGILCHKGLSLFSWRRKMVDHSQNKEDSAIKHGIETENNIYRNLYSSRSHIFCIVQKSDPLQENIQFWCKTDMSKSINDKWIHQRVVGQ